MDKKKLLVIGDSRLTEQMFDQIERTVQAQEYFKIKRVISYEKHALGKDLAHSIENGNYYVVIIGPTPHKISGIESGVSLSNWVRSLGSAVNVIEARTSSNQLKFTRKSYRDALEKALGSVSSQ